MTRLTPKLHSLTTLVSPKSSKCNISIGNGQIVFKFYTEVKYLKQNCQISECINWIEVNNNKMTFNIDDVTDRCRVIMTTEWQNELQTKPKLRTYKIFKNCLTVEPYALYHVPKWTRSICAQFRMGILPLHI